MTPEQTVTYAKEALMLLAVTAGPVVLVALIVGLIMSVVQATTQIQEPTLSFVPKIICVGLALVALGPHITQTLVTFLRLCFGRAAMVLHGG